MNMDVIVVGAGPIGSATAAGLARAGMRVALVDRVDPTLSDTHAADGRAFAISLGSQKILQEYDIWEDVSGTATPIHRIHVSQENEAGFLTFDKGDAEVEALGYMIPATALRQGLAQGAKRKENVVWHAPATIKSITRTPYWAEVLLTDGTLLHGALLIAADGRNSVLRHEAGLETHGWRYDQHALICTFTHTHPHHHTAWEHFLPSGPFAVLPLQGDQSALVWTVSPVEAEALCQLSDAAFITRLEEQVAPVLGDVTDVTPRLNYPLSVCLSRHFYEARLALVGDAAHAIHPVAGQALNLGFRDVEVLVQLLTEAHILGLDKGSPTLLRAYEKRRRFDVVVMTSVTDGLVRLFGIQNRAVRKLTHWGLAAFDRLPFLKRWTMKYAVGGL